MAPAPQLEVILPAVTATMLLTVGAGLVAFGGVSRSVRSRELFWAGLFSALYGVRIVISSELGSAIAGGAGWLPYAESALEYLVPIPGTILFSHLLGSRWRRLNRAVVWPFVALAAVAIPWEIATASPWAFNGVVDALVIGLLLVLALNLMTGDPERGSERRILRGGALVFALFVLNEHFGWVDTGSDLLAEPLGFLVLMGSIVWAAMARAIRIEGNLAAVRSELDTARKIQASILPAAPPHVPGWEIAALYRPASDVGGDFYDFIRLAGSRDAIVLADVSGHGVPAALLASMLKIAVAISAEEITTPGALLAALDARLRGAIGKNFFTAVAVAMGERGATLAAGGHPAALLLSVDGRMESIESGGPLLGRFREAAFPEREVAMGPGDALFLYTDGLTEASGARGEPWGEARLRAALADLVRAPAATLETLLAHCLAWTGSDSLEDDVTMILLRKTG